jgi:hypothetical protein
MPLPAIPALLGLAPWKLIGYGLALIAVLLLVRAGYVGVRNHFYKDRDAYWQPKVAALTTERDNWIAVAAECDTRTQKAVDAGKARDRRASEAMKAAGKQATYWQDQYALLYKLAQKPPAGATCVLGVEHATEGMR